MYFGHFYQITICGVEYSCRSTLEIVRPCSQAQADRITRSPSVLLDCEPDAVFVMLNPGSSHPLVARNVAPVASPSEIETHARSNLVPTVPDDTQKQIAYVMSRRGFCHARVLNLFDIREPQSSSLIRKVRDSLRLQPRQHMPDVPDVLSYSVFSDDRRQELRHRLCTRDPQNTVVVAWSRHRRLDRFFMKCHEILTSEHSRIHGKPAGPSCRRRFDHPLPRKEQLRRDWRNCIVDHWPDNAQQ